MKNYQNYIKIFCIIFLAVLLLGSQNSLSKYGIVESVEVGMQPIAIIKSEIWDPGHSVNHVFCLGSDEESPSLWIIEDLILISLDMPNKEKKSIQDSYSDKIQDFNFSSLTYPFRPGIDPKNKIVYSLDNQISYENYIIPYKAHGLSINDSIFFISKRDSGIDSLIVYNYLESKVKQVLAMNNNIQMSKLYKINGLEKLAVLCEGDDGENNSTISLHEFDFENVQNTYKVLEIGDYGNYFEIISDTLFAVCKGSNELVLIDLNSEEIVRRIDLSEYNIINPMEIDINSESRSAVISSEDGRFLIINLYTWEVDDSNIYSGVGEGILIESFVNNSERVFLCLPRDNQGNLNNEVLIFADYSGVDEFEEDDLITAYPNPSNDMITIDYSKMDIQAKSISIMDLMGNEVYTMSGNGLSGVVDLNISNLGLAAGKYFAIIKTNKLNYYISIIIQ
jgi:Secretion system C-terminal sorting domain